MDSWQWPEPVVRVQAIAESGVTTIPKNYIKPPSKRPSPPNTSQHSVEAGVDIPVIDLQYLMNDNDNFHEETVRLIGSACREWGFLQVVNHGVSPNLIKRAVKNWRKFFKLPLEEKQNYANDPYTYEGYGSRLGNQKGAILDWSDYYFLHYLPASFRKYNKWPLEPPSCRESIHEFCESVAGLGEIMLRVLSLSLGLGEHHFFKNFGGTRNCEAIFRANYYPKCPQPDLTLGLSEHSDPGGLTILLPDEHVGGLQVRKHKRWFDVKPVSNALVMNIGDQIEIISNSIYKSVEHRVVVNSIKDRLSLAFFYNPKHDLIIEPAKALVTKDRPALYSPMTFGEYRLHIMTNGLSGKEHVESLKSCK